MVEKDVSVQGAAGTESPTRELTEKLPKHEAQPSFLSTHEGSRPGGTASNFRRVLEARQRMVGPHTSGALLRPPTGSRRSGCAAGEG